MTEAALFKILWSWVELVLNTIKAEQTGGEVLIIFSDPNAPVPDGSYIVIQRPLDTQAAFGSGNVTKADTDGEIAVSQTYTGVVNIQQIDGGRDNLNYLVESLNKKAVKEYFASVDLSILDTEDIINTTRDKGQFKIRGASMDVRIAYTSHDIDTPGYIDEIDFTGEYEGEKI